MLPTKQITIQFNFSKCNFNLIKQCVVKFILYLAHGRVTAEKIKYVLETSARFKLLAFSNLLWISCIKFLKGSRCFILSYGSIDTYKMIKHIGLVGHDV